MAIAATLIVAGVIWIQANWGANAAGIAVIIVGTIAVLSFWDMLGLAKRQADGNLRVAEKQIDSNIKREEVKGENIVAKYEAQMRLKEHIFLLSTIAKLIGARQPTQPTQAAEPEEDQDVVDLTSIKAIQWNHHDL